MLSSSLLKKEYFKLRRVYSQHKIKNHSRRNVRKNLNDKIITKEQKKKVKDFYKPYKKITMDFHEFYYQKTGKFYENYLPDDLYYCDIDMYFNDWNAGQIIDNKCFYQRMFPDLRQPEIIAYRMNNFWYDKDMHIVKKEDIIRNIEKEEKIFVKYATESAGGKGVFYIDNRDKGIEEKFLKVVETDKQDIVIQKAMQQHEVLASLNSSSVNTIRILSLLNDEEVKIYSAILRMGVNDSKVDNASSGGITCGINKDGRLKEVAYFVNGKKYSEHPTSGVKFSDIKIPKFEEMCELVRKSHPLIPHFRLASWDIALDKNEEIVLIEVNLKYGELDFHQLNNGPLFGKDTKLILDEVFKKKTENK